MAATSVEKIDARSSSTSIANEQVEVVYLIRGATSDANARATLLAGSPTTWTGDNGTLRRQQWEVKERRGTNLWDGTVTYQMPDWGQKPTGDTVFTFDTTGGTQHISFSKGTVHRYPSGTNGAPDLGGAINVSGQDVGGVDITIPAFSFTATGYFASTTVDATFLENIYDATGKVNDATWTPTIDGFTLEFFEGEVLCLGATGSRRGIGDVEISYHFSANQNVTSLTVGSVTGIAKRGWEYLWVSSRPKSFGSGSNIAIFAQPVYVYIEKVYDEVSFPGLGM